MGDEPIESKEETSQMRQKEIIAELVNYLLGLWPNESNEQVESIPPPLFFPRRSSSSFVMLSEECLEFHSDFLVEKEIIGKKRKRWKLEEILATIRMEFHLSFFTPILPLKLRGYCFSFKRSRLRIESYPALSASDISQDAPFFFWLDKNVDQLSSRSCDWK